MFPIEAFRATLSNLTRILRQHNIRFQLTGGLTSTAYGEPRITQDIDVVIDLVTAKAHVNELVRSISDARFMYNEDSMCQAIQTGGLFKLLDAYHP